MRFWRGVLRPVGGKSISMKAVIQERIISKRMARGCKTYVNNSDTRNIIEAASSFLVSILFIKPVLLLSIDFSLLIPTLGIPNVECYLLQYTQLSCDCSLELSTSPVEALFSYYYLKMLNLIGLEAARELNLLFATQPLVRK